jgi:hypothetical protein
MKYFNSLLIACLMFTLMGCPWLDSPPPLSPLPIAKNSNTAFKAANQQCRLINDGTNSYSYDASGNIISGNYLYATNITYNPAGLITQATYSGLGRSGTLTFTYDDNNLLKLVKRSGAISYDLFKYSNGVFIGQERIENNTDKVQLVFPANSLGQAIGLGDPSRPQLDIIWQYDSRGNLISSTDGGSIVTYEYDDKINPIYQAYRFIKGQGSVFNPSIASVIFGQAGVFAISPNNMIKSTYSPAGTNSFTPITSIVRFTYNAQNLPLTRSVNGETPTTYTYENCQ